jgi:hypothetical protein
MTAKTFFNVGSVDRVLRAALGLAVLSLAFVGPETPWGYLGLVPLFTAAIGWCPLYTLLGINTCPAPKASR